ncbi:MAG: hypothetical protein JNN01_20910 [Opitutaceae bacterium]|nr:hypothetical protein [Opitutaceae bacterium]
MNPHPRGLSRSFIPLALGLAVLPWLAGCTGVLATKQRVFVDAITAPPEPPKEGGTSYRLLAKKSVVSGQPVHVPAVIACVNAALAGKGLYEAPANTPADLFIEVSYGRNMLPREVPHANEAYLQLTARKNIARSLEPTTVEEVWDVKVAVPGVTGRMEVALPLLAAVASEHIGADTQYEVPVDVLKKSPVVESVLLNAQKAIRAQEVRRTTKAPEPASAASPETPAPPSPSPPPSS